MLEDVEKMKKGELMISAEEFDRRFDSGESVDDFLDINNPLKLEDLVEEKITLSLPKSIKEKIVSISKRLNLNIEDTVKVLLAKEVGLI